jgi:hypothetical protein
LAGGSPWIHSCHRLIWVFRWRFRAGLPWGSCMENNNCTLEMAFGTSISPHRKFQLSSDIWCLHNISASQMNQLLLFSFPFVHTCDPFCPSCTQATPLTLLERTWRRSQLLFTFLKHCPLTFCVGQLVSEFIP